MYPKKGYGDHGIWSNPDSALPELKFKGDLFGIFHETKEKDTRNITYFYYALMLRHICFCSNEDYRSVNKYF